MKQLTKIFENNGFDIHAIERQDGDVFIEFGQYTPAGEDWFISIYYNGYKENLIEKIKEYYENFDVDEAVEPFIECRGKNGVPSSIRELVEDAEWKDNKLADLSYDLMEAKDAKHRV